MPTTKFWAAVALADDTKKNTFSVLTESSKCGQGVVTKPVTLPLYKYTSMLVTSSSSGALVLEHTDKRAGYTTVQVARSPLAGTPDKRFCVLLIILSRGTVHIPGLIIVAHVTYSPVYIILMNAALLGTKPEEIETVHYRPPIYRITQKTCHKDVGAIIDQNLTFKWKSTVQVLDDYAKYHGQFLNTLSEFQSTWNVLFGQVNIVKKRIEVTGEHTQPTHLVSHQANRKTRMYDK